MQEFLKSYEPGEVEEKWYDKWLKSGVFEPDVNDLDKEPYSVMIPPPNVTGVLTMGHVLNNTIQDILVRRARQEGKNVLWQPGTDHAGIATQTKVERVLKKEGKTKYDLGRDAFVEQVKQWRDDHGGKIIHQLQRLGASCNWKRIVHTLDEDYSEAVLKAFVTLYKRGYIYRGKRMVNWCPVSLTALSDEEVIMKSSKSFLYKVKYELVDHPGEFLEVSTTRPETIMGDVALAVNPEDERYKTLIGKKVWRPINREKIVIIGDSAVEMDFGTGVLKVTPAHDPVDFEIGARHNLEILDIMNPDGTLNALAGKEFEGVDRFVARKHAVNYLKEKELLIAEEKHDNNVGYSERADVPVEPRVSEQWFMKYPKVDEAKALVANGKIKFWPKRWEKTYLHWLENIQDWCISRQLWWGHRIPVWYKKGKDRTNPANWHVSLQGPNDKENWEQDEDVLDTWASSWVWPFATLGWPDEAESQKRGLYKFFPTSDLVTGPDIIFFWVARMIMASLEFIGEEKEHLEIEEMDDRIAFKNVYFTGIVRDAQGRKMSKSLGNSPDPIELIDKHGADGLRFGIMSIAAQGQDVMFAEDRVEQGKKFCNKFWNACRFRQMNGSIEDNSSLQSILDRLDADLFDADDHAILWKMIELIDSVAKSLKAYEFNQVVQEISSFFWGDYCDWYLEVSKAKMQDDALKANCLAIQDLVIRQLLKLLHPYTPFITEELWHNMGYATNGAFIGLEPLDQAEELKEKLSLNVEAVEEIAHLRAFVSQGRSLKAAFKLAPRKDLVFTYSTGEKHAAVIKNHEDKLLKLLGAKSLTRVKKEDKSPAEVTPLGTLYLKLDGEVDIESEIARLNKELKSLAQKVQIGQNKLKDERFLNNAPEAIIDGAKKQLEESLNSYNEVKRLLNMFL